MQAPAPFPEPWIPASPATAPRAPLLRYAAVALLILAVAFGVGLAPRLRQRQRVVEASRELAIPTVTVVSPLPGRLSAPVSLPAEIRPLIEAAIHARATGYVKQWWADLGSSVTNGQLLAELDTPEIAQQLAQAKARVSEAEAAQALARTSAARWEEMRRIKAVSAQDADERTADLAFKTAQLESARAEVGRLESLIGFARITAPFDGTLTARRLQVGQLVSAGDGAELFRLAQTASLRVFVRIPQTLARSVTIGQTGEVSFTEMPGQHFPARVVRTAGALDAASRTLLTELELPNPDGSILPGGYAQVRLPDLHPEPVLTLPSNTLLFRSEGPQVAVAGSDGKVELRTVTLGRDLGSSLEILGGVSATDRVVLNPPDSLAEGAVVRIAEAKPARGA